ncbi:amidohydrolase family protein [Cohnella sp. CBP 2801]|uniref:Amidohydrolase family protein n=2 Tax=Cohnella zeiphila TaxID=2761120 RepID=A0A7X0SQ05_9BACL|nr:amidohydrolase family protein [Cohnella zeiphila]
MTTLNGAGFLDRMNDMGTVEIGKNADLVLPDANPQNYPHDDREFCKFL